MEMIKTTVTGMKDILPSEMDLRQYLLTTLRNVYSLYGFSEIETPAMEHIANLLSDNGWENEKLIFKVLKRGDKLKEAMETNDLSNMVDSGLRYDLTVPLCRYYANNKDKLITPFKSLQIGNVYRADRPQKGRFRQFTQCDIDIIGEDRNIAEIDLLLATSTFLKQIGFEKYDFCFNINDRRILKSMIEYAGFKIDDFDKICIILDKIDKIGNDKVREELYNIGYDEKVVDKYFELLFGLNNNETEKNLQGTIEDIKCLQNKLSEFLDSEVSENLIQIITTVSKVNNAKIVFNPTLVRGMGYYTGPIFEINAKGFNGSIGGGGRYDNMVYKFTKQETKAVGISIGFERIITILQDDNFVIKKDTDKIAFMLEKDLSYEKLNEVYAEAKKLRDSGHVVFITTMQKNKRFQRDNLSQNGFTKFVDWTNE